MYFCKNAGYLIKILIFFFSKYFVFRKKMLQHQILGICFAIWIPCLKLLLNSLKQALNYNNHLIHEMSISIELHLIWSHCLLWHLRTLVPGLKTFQFTDMNTFGELFCIHFQPRKSVRQFGQMLNCHENAENFWPL